MSVLQTDSLTAAARLRDLAPAVLVFANARIPGGGWRVGATGQEEDICRATPLGEVLEGDHADVQAFYQAGRSAGWLNTDKVLYVPKCTEFDFLVCAAPQAHRWKGPDEVRHQAIQRRAKRIVRVAEAQGNKALVLGAWGCGAFHNEPLVVARAFVDALRDSYHLAHATFACPDPRLAELFTQETRR